MCACNGLNFRSEKDADLRKKLKKFGKSLKAQRVGRGWTCQRLADVLTTDVTYIWRLENGFRRPGEDVVIILGVLLSEQGNPVGTVKLINVWLRLAGYRPLKKKRGEPFGFQAE